MFVKARSQSKFIPTPCKEGKLKGILKKYKIDKVEYKTRTIKPKMVIARLNNRNTFNDFALFLNSKTHFRNYHLQFRPYHQYYN